MSTATETAKEGEASQNNGILFAKGKPEVIFQTTSRMAELVGYQDEAGKWVEKRPCPWDLKELDKHKRSTEAAKINHLTQWFRGGLIELNVPLTRISEFLVTEDGFPVHKMSYEGRNCVQNITRNPRDGNRILGKICEAISSLVEQDEPWDFAMDLRPDNFCINGSNDGVIFTDTFPPLCRDRNDNFWVHYPNPTDRSVIEREKSRKFNLIGSMRRLAFFIMWINPEWEKSFTTQVIKQFPHSISNRILNEFAILLDRMMVGQSKIKKREIIESLPCAEDTLREIAVRFIPSNHPQRVEILNLIFRLSSSYTDSEMRDTQEQRFDKAKKLLIKEAGF